MTYQPAPVTMVAADAGWSTGPFECFADFGSALDNYFCPWCANARQWDAVEGRPDSMNMMIFLANCCLGTQYILNCVVRNNIISKFNIPESPIVGCCLACWLPSCTMCQNHRELANRGLFPGGFCCEPPAGYIQSPNVAVMGGQPVAVVQQA